MPDVHLTLTAQEFDYLCKTLSQRPWVEVNNLLQKIVAQANESQGTGPVTNLGTG